MRHAGGGPTSSPPPQNLLYTSTASRRPSAVAPCPVAGAAEGEGVQEGGVGVAGEKRSVSIPAG